MDAELIVPVYVDTNALLDLLASIEGGFTAVEKVTTRSASSAGSEKSISAEAGTEFGIPNVLNLLKVRMGGDLKGTKQHATAEQRESDRYHTYGSLLYRLRGHLDAEGLTKRPQDDDGAWAELQPSDFVSVRGVLRPNPLADSLERIDRMTGLAELVSGLGGPASGQTAQAQKKAAQEEKKQMRQIRQFIQGLLADIAKQNTRVFVIDPLTPDGMSTVSLLFTDYLRDQTMEEVSHKEYRLLGKVVRKVETDSNESIDLLRGTGLGGLGKDMVDQLVGSFTEIEGFELPEVTTSVSGPALEVVPIAIYV